MHGRTKCDEMRCVARKRSQESYLVYQQVTGGRQTVSARSARFLNITFNGLR